MIQARVVGDEVEHQLQAALPEPLAQAGQRRVAPEVGMHRVAGDRETRSRRCPPRAGPAASPRTPVAIRGCCARPAGRPARSARRSGARPSRSPSRPGGPARRRECRRAWRPAQLPGQLRQPDAGVDLVQRRIAKWRHRRDSSREPLQQHPQQFLEDFLCRHDGERQGKERDQGRHGSLDDRVRPKGTAPMPRTTS